jgi:hypothetical protein
MSWGIVASVGASLIGSAITSDAAGDAADTQADATDRGIAEQRRQFDLTREDFSPYREAGRNALTSLVGDINAPMNPRDVMSDPGYQFGMDQGQQALDRKISAMGGRVSGAALKAAARFGTNYASTGYNAAYQRRQDRLNRLAAIAGIGQTATGASAQAGAGSANQISGLLSSQGDASAAARLSQGNVWGNQANQLAAMYLRRPQTPASGWYDDPSQIPMQPGGGF